MGGGEGDLGADARPGAGSAEGVVREPVWELSLDSAGLAVRFKCSSSEIHARWQLRKPSLAMKL